MIFRALTCAVVLACCTLNAAQYYVDFDGGSDAANGTSTGTPFKHCPGDPNATGTANGTTPGAGDTVYFKGGVYYRGIITLKAGGADGNPVTYKGNGWGTPNAIIDGSDIIASGSWTKCASSADVGGNSHWSHIYYTTLPSLPSYINSQQALTLNIYQDLLPVPVAESPVCTSDYYQTPNSYSTPQSSTVTTITDTAISTSANGITNSGYVYIYYVNEEVARAVTSWDGISQIGFSSSGTKAVSYALANSTNDLIFSQANQYVYSESNNKLWVWPKNEANLTTGAATITYSLRPYGIHLNEKNFVVVDGFLFQKQTGPDTVSGVYGSTGAAIKKSSSGLCVGITIKNCEVTGCYTFQDWHSVALVGAQGFYFGSNYLHDTRGRIRGVYSSNGTNTWITNNTFLNLARTTVFTEFMTNLVVGGNIITNCQGTHGNGISPYNYSENITVSSNKIYDSNIGITYSHSGNTTTVNNFIDRKNNNADNGNYDCAFWDSMRGTNYVLNNTFVRSPIHYAFFWEAVNDTASAKYVVENNVFDGGMIVDYSSNSLTNNNNWFTGLSFQQGSYSYGSGEFLNSNITTNFVDSANGVFQLTATSVGRGSGLDLTTYGYTSDVLGIIRPNGSAWDIGAYEYVTPTVQNINAQTLNVGTLTTIH